MNDDYTEKLTKSNIILPGNTFEYTAPALSVTTFLIPVEISPAQLDEGRYYIRNKAANLYVGINNASANLGAQLVITGETASSNSAFDVQMDELNGGFMLKPGHLSSSSNYVLDVQGTTNSDRANIIQYADWGGDNQRFHFVHLEENYYKIIIRRSMKCWSIPDANYEIGTPVLQMTWDEADHSVWEVLSNPSSFREIPGQAGFYAHYYSGILNVRTSDNKTFTGLYVMNILGKIMKQVKNIESSYYSFPLEVDPGLYLVKATLSDGNSANNLFWTF